jgi:hypothetical protein
MLPLYEGCAASPVAPPVDQVRLSPPTHLAGDYTLTIDLDDSCNLVQSVERWRFSAALKDSSGYFSVEVSGGPFVQPTVIGQFYVYGDSSFRLMLNLNYDGLGQFPTPPYLMIYGIGDAQWVSAQITGAIRAAASVFANDGKRDCTGVHQFVLARK